MDGWDANETNTDTKEAYKNGSANIVKPKLLRKAKKRNRTVAFNPIKNDIPKPIFFSLPKKTTTKSTTGKSPN